MKVLLEICIILCLLTSVGANRVKAQNQLADSLFAEINNPTCDSVQLATIFNSIIKNRRNLESEYLPILHHFAKQSEIINYQTGLMQSYDRIGLQLRYSENYDSAIFYHNASLQINYILKDSNQLYYNYNNLGQAYRMQDLSVQAIYYFQKALSIAEGVGNKKSVSHTLNSLGASYVVQKEFNQAMICFKASSEIALKRDDKRTLAYNHGSIGEVFLMQNQNDSAMYYFVLSKNLIEELGGNRGLGVAYHLIAQAQFAQGNFTQSSVNFQKAISLHAKHKNKRYLALCYAYMGRINTQLNNSDSAYWYLNTGLKYAESIHSFENITIIYDALYTLNKQQNKWEDATLALQQSYAYQDSIINIENNKEIQSLKISYETTKKENQIKLLSTENKLKSQRMNMAMILVIILLLSILVGIYMQALKKNQSIYEKDKLKQQLMLSQMNPHFIFNALGSIQSFMYRNEAKKAAAYLGNFAALSRSILHNSTEEKVSLEEEIKTLENYLELEKMRMDNSFSYEFILSADLDLEFIQIPPMMLQPFVENSIKHGIKQIDYPGLIEIKIEDKTKFLKIEIIDNGIGIDQASKVKKDHQSKATNILAQRMRILKHQFKHIPELVIIDQKTENKQGTKVCIHLPIFEA